MNLGPLGRARLAEVVQLFETNRLGLPHLTVEYLEDRENCGGHLGLFRSNAGELRIILCSSSAFVLVHELAHAWLSSNVDKVTEAAYMDLRGFTVWNSHDVEWSDRAVEDAAIVISQILTVGPGPDRSPGWASRREAFELLTGLAATSIRR